MEQGPLPPVATSDVCQTRPVTDDRIRNRRERLVLECGSAHLGEASWFGLTGDTQVFGRKLKSGQAAGDGGPQGRVVRVVAAPGR